MLQYVEWTHCLGHVDTSSAGLLRRSFFPGRRARWATDKKNPSPLWRAGVGVDGGDESRKRPIEEGGADEDRSKRANLGGDADKPSAIKVCVHSCSSSVV